MTISCFQGWAVVPLSGVATIAVVPLSGWAQLPFLPFRVGTVAIVPLSGQGKIAIGPINKAFFKKINRCKGKFKTCTLCSKNNFPYNVS